MAGTSPAMTKEESCIALASHVRAYRHRAGARARQVFVRIEIMHRALRRIANLGAAGVDAVHAVVVIDEMAGRDFGVAAEIGIGWRLVTLEMREPPAML